MVPRCPEQQNRPVQECWGRECQESGPLTWWIPGLGQRSLNRGRCQCDPRQWPALAAGRAPGSLPTLLVSALPCLSLCPWEAGKPLPVCSLTHLPAPSCCLLAHLAPEAPGLSPPQGHGSSARVQPLPVLLPSLQPLMAPCDTHRLGLPRPQQMQQTPPSDVSGHPCSRHFLLASADCRRPGHLCDVPGGPGGSCAGVWSAALTSLVSFRSRLCVMPW